MLGRKLELLLNAIKRRKLLNKLNLLEKERTMPMGKGTYGKTRGRPPKKPTTPPKKKILKKKK
tara:strand:- start:400 stop:588 length:189 start_codon:yes stop_codon:yes gene_type:complete